MKHKQKSANELELIKLEGMLEKRQDELDALENQMRTGSINMKLINDVNIARTAVKNLEYSICELKCIIYPKMAQKYRYDFGIKYAG